MSKSPPRQCFTDPFVDKAVVGAGIKRLSLALLIASGKASG